MVPQKFPYSLIKGSEVCEEDQFTFPESEKKTNRFVFKNEMAAAAALNQAKASRAVNNNLLRLAIDKLAELFILMDQEDGDGA